jgi:hypothetical protein
MITITASGYSDVITPLEAGNTTITWNIVEAPDVPFDWLDRSYTVLNSWLADAGSKMTFKVTEIGSSDSYVTGDLTLGNMTIRANNTDIAFNLVLAISNFMAPWEPGLVIPTGATNIDAQNTSAYAAAARVVGNYVNGTVSSEYDNVTIGSTTYECIVWDYAQDPTGFGAPQNTTLAYDLSTGVLVRANTSVSFGTPYNLIIELESIQQPLTLDLPILILAVVGIGVVVVVVVAIQFLKRR